MGGIKVTAEKIYEDIGYLKRSIESLNNFVRTHMDKEEKANKRLATVLGSIMIMQIASLSGVTLDQFGSWVRVASAWVGLVL